MKKIAIVFNHVYQLSNFVPHNDVHYVFINISHINININSLDNIDEHTSFDYLYYPLLEALCLRKRKTVKLQFSVLHDCQKIICFGLQDYISWSIAKYASANFIDVEIVPDNVEFYLRSDSFDCINDAYQVKGILKSFLDGTFLNYLKKEIVHWSGRPIYSIKNIDFTINDELAFYSKLLLKPAENTEIDNFKYSYGFISQPYYIDYNIDVVEWVSCLVEAISISGFRIEDCVIFLHQRDSEEYKVELKKKNIKFTYSKNLPNNILGIFSTYLFQLSINGYEVHSLAKYFFKLLPSYYTDYLILASEKFNVSCLSQDTWNVKKSNFYKLNSNL